MLEYNIDRTFKNNKEIITIFDEINFRYTIIESDFELADVKVYSNVKDISESIIYELLEENPTYEYIEVVRKIFYSMVDNYLDLNNEDYSTSFYYYDSSTTINKIKDLEKDIANLLKKYRFISEYYSLENMIEDKIVLTNEENKILKIYDNKEEEVSNLVSNVIENIPKKASINL